MATLITALGIGSVYTLVALGFNAIYRATQIFNFAQGAIVAVTSLFVFSAVTVWGLPLLLVLAMAAGLGLALAVIEYFLAVRPIITRRTVTHAWLVATIGALSVLTAAAQILWGTDAHDVSLGLLDDLVALGSSRVGVADLVAIGAALAVTVALDGWYAWSRPGKRLRAAAEDRDAAEVRGINTNRVALLSFALAGLLAGAAAIIVIPLTFARADLGNLLLINVFVTLAIGGFGSNRGAIIGGWAVGLAQTYAALWFGVIYEDIMVFGLLLMTLLVLPRGIFGTFVERRV